MSEQNNQEQPETITENNLEDIGMTMLDETEPTKPEVKEAAKVASVIGRQQEFIKEDVIYSDTINFPSYRSDAAREVMKSIPEIPASSADKEWAECIAGGATMTVSEDGFTSALDSRLFTNAPSFNGKTLRISQPAKSTKGGAIKEVTGENAVISLVGYMKQGGFRYIPMWHSGFWVLFRPPTNSELLNLHHNIISDKIEIGRYTYGQAFSSVSVITVSRLLEFARDHVYSTSVSGEELNSSNILQYLDVRDIYAFIFGEACAMNPKGIKYSRSCYADIEQCKHKTMGVIDPTELLMVNFDSLTDQQKHFMHNNKTGSQKLEAVLEYQKSLLSNIEREVDISTDPEAPLFVKLRHISAAKKISSGMDWINSMTIAVDEILASDAMLGQRNEAYNKHAVATGMRQYAHFVESIRTDTSLVVDRESIGKSLGAISGDHEVRTNFINAVRKFIDDTIISCVGLGTLICPSCKKPANIIKTENGEEVDACIYPHMTEVIPLDVTQLFFEILSQRVTQLLTAK